MHKIVYTFAIEITSKTNKSLWKTKQNKWELQRDSAI